MKLQCLVLPKRNMVPFWTLTPLSKTTTLYWIQRGSLSQTLAHWVSHGSSNGILGANRMGGLPHFPNSHLILRGVWGGWTNLPTFGGQVGSLNIAHLAYHKSPSPPDTFCGEKKDTSLDRKTSLLREKALFSRRCTCMLGTCRREPP